MHIKPAITLQGSQKLCTVSPYFTPREVTLRTVDAPVCPANRGPEHHPLAYLVAGVSLAALAMIAAYFGIPITLVMPDNSTQERIDTMRAMKLMPEIEQKLQTGELQMVVVSQAQSFFRQEKKID